MSKLENFLTDTEEQHVIVAIREAEQNTSGEIRIHIERSSYITPFKRALEVFGMLKMFNTKQNNAVLFYIAVDDHQFVIYGDKGINAVVSNDFWDTTKDVVQNHFALGNFEQGIIDGVLQIGKALKVHFPRGENDDNELLDEISKG